MPTTTRPNDQIQARIRAVRAQMSELREERSRASAELDQAKAAFVALNVDPDAATRRPEYAAALKASERLAGVRDRLERAAGEERDLLTMLDGSPRSDGQPEALGDLSAPGAWLADVARRNAGPVGALAAAITTETFGSVTDVGTPFVDRLSTASAIMASGPAVISIDTTEIKIPRLAGRLAPAPIVPELDPIPEVAAPLDDVVIRPPKIATLAVLSEEAWADARPAVLAAHEREMVRSVASGFDVAAFDGVPGEPDLPGILGTSGTAAVDAGGTLVNLDPFVDAIAALRAVGATATAFYMHPMTWARLGRLKKATDSAEPLVSAQLVTSGPRESILGVPVFLTEWLEEGAAVVAQASELLVVRRTRVEVRVAENFKFAEAGVGVRVIFRAALVVPQPEAVCVISGLPEPEGSGS